MKEFMLLIRNNGDSKAAMSPAEHQQFLDACRVFINELTSNGNLISAQPLARDGKTVSGNVGAFIEGPYQENEEIIVGYYRVLAKDLDDAVAIAKRNPEFVYSRDAKIEVRPIKMVEESTSYIYPTEATKK